MTDIELNGWTFRFYFKGNYHEPGSFHSKLAIIDDKYAYVGSANVTPAGLGQGVFTPGNFEAGILTEDPGVISSIKDFFSMIWDEKWCFNCHRADKCQV